MKIIKKREQGEYKTGALIVYQTYPYLRLFINIFGYRFEILKPKFMRHWRAKYLCRIGIHKPFEGFIRNFHYSYVCLWCGFVQDNFKNTDTYKNEQAN